MIRVGPVEEVPITQTICFLKLIKEEVQTTEIQGQVDYGQIVDAISILQRLLAGKIK